MPNRRSARQARNRAKMETSDTGAHIPHSSVDSTSDHSSGADSNIKRARGGESPPPSEISTQSQQNFQSPIDTSKGINSLTQLVQDVQDESENFEALVQGKTGAEQDANSPHPSQSSPSVSDHTPSKPSPSNNGIESTPVGQMTLFHHGFNKIGEHVKSDLKKLTSSAKKFSINPFPTQKEQDEYVAKHGQDKFVSGIGFNMIKVEPGTFARMDDEQATRMDHEKSSTSNTLVNEEDGEIVASQQDTSNSPTKAGNSQQDESNSSQSGNDEGTSVLPVSDKKSPGQEQSESPESPNAQQDDNSQNPQEPHAVGNKGQSIKSSEMKPAGKESSLVPESEIPSPTDDIEFPSNDDNLEETVVPVKPPPKKKKSKKKKQQRLSHSATSTQIEIADTLSEDSHNTIDSNQASYDLTNEEGRRQIPPSFVRYRVGILLDNVDLINNTAADATEQISPSDQYKVILKDLVSCVFNMDKDAKFVTWKNDPKFKLLSANPSEFPTRVETIASFFDGFKSKLKEGIKKFFQFCIHSPALSNMSVEKSLLEWAKVNSHTLYECTLQAESSKKIGWLVYSMPFTNTTFLKSLMKSRSGHEWGFKYSAFTDNDKSLDWKLRLKALEILVPAEKENAARALVSDTFKQRPYATSFKSVTECYIYVGNEREHKQENMATIFLEMVGRHKFQLNYLEFVPVTCIIKSIDNKISTRDKKTFLTLREMILNLNSRDNKYGVQKLFQSVDFVPNPTSVWYKKVKGEGSACYYLTYYKWAEGEALHTAEGLGAYLGKQFGLSGLYSSFSADHWEFVKQWKWNVQKQKYDTPQEMNLAENVMFDPTASIMRKVQEENIITTTSEIDNTAPLESQGLETIEEADGQNEVITQLGNTSARADQNPYTYDEETASNALSIAMSIQSASSMSNSLVSSASTTLSQLELRRANEIVQGQMDPDQNSLGNADGAMTNVQQVFHNDEMSTTSSMTDITDNTANNAYHNLVNEDTTSVASNDTSLTLNSLDATQLRNYVQPNMSTEDMEKSLNKMLKDTHRNNQRKANMMLVQILREQRASEQSASNCDTGDNP